MIPWDKIGKWVVTAAIPAILGYAATYVLDLHDRVVSLEAYTKGIVEIMIETKKKEGK